MLERLVRSRQVGFELSISHERFYTPNRVETPRQMVKI
jgi:hypothetical protein